MEIHIHLVYPNALQPDEWPRESAGTFVQVSEFFAHHVSAADMQNPKVTSCPMHGVWNRVTPWLPWMLMGQTPGHCQYACFMGSGNDLDEIFSAQGAGLHREEVPEVLSAAGEMVRRQPLEPGDTTPSEQKPAPVKPAL